jgi:chromosome segregation ATPase
MRRAFWLAAIAAIAAFPPSGHCQQQDPAKSPLQNSAAAQSSAQVPAPAQTAPTQQESLAEAARRAREQKKDTPKQAKVITNDNIPKEGGISAVGEEPRAAENAENAPADAAKSDKAAESDEKKWRTRFEKLRHKLEQDQADLDVMQRELGVLDLQYYNDPVKAMQQELTRSDINEKRAKIAAKQKEIEADKQAISDAEDELRQSGGDPGWAR